MTVTSAGEGYLANIPGVVVVRAQQDIGFALRLLNRETRDEAFREAGLDLRDDELSRLSSLLDEIAGLSFEEILQKLRDEGSVFF